MKKLKLKGQTEPTMSRRMEISVTETKGKFPETKAGSWRRSIKLINFYQTDWGVGGIIRNDVSMSKKER